MIDATQMFSLEDVIRASRKANAPNPAWQETNEARYRAEFAAAARSLGVPVECVRMCGEAHSDGSSWQSGIHYHAVDGGGR